jgi:hypothetical protein
LHFKSLVTEHNGSLIVTYNPEQCEKVAKLIVYV